MISTSYGVRFFDLRVREVDLRPVVLEELELVGRRAACAVVFGGELVRGREEEALELRWRPCANARRRLRGLRRGAYASAESFGVILRFCCAMLADRRDPLDHLLPREALREDDAQHAASARRSAPASARPRGSDAADRAADEPGGEAEERATSSDRRR